MTNPIKSYTKKDIDEALDKAWRIEEILKSYDGRYTFAYGARLNVPWHMSNHAHKEGCAFWSNVMDKSCFIKGRSFIPYACLNCWKVVIRPRTLKELYKLRDIIEELKLKSKCGIETRGEVGALYGGYFYNENLESGLITKDMLHNKLGHAIFYDIPAKDLENYIFLKRGCTEYEMGHGDSKNWRPFPGQSEIEKYIEDSIDIVKVTEKQSEEMRAVVYDRWNKFAFSAGDKTYLEFTGGKPPFPAYRTYHSNGG